MNKYLTLLVIISTFIFGCKKDDDSQPLGPGFEFVEVNVVLPQGSDFDLSGSTIISLGSDSELDVDNKGRVPYNNGSVELVYLLNSEDQLMLAGFITDVNRQISVETTAEVMLYFALDYYLLNHNAKKSFLAKIKQVPGFADLVGDLENLFVNNPLMYDEGAYLSIIDNKIDEISRKVSTGEEEEGKEEKEGAKSDERIFINDTKTKSGITISSTDATHVILQNSFPRRTRVIGYKKSYYSRNGDFAEVPQYWNKPIIDFKFEPGKKFDYAEIGVGSSIAANNASLGSTDLASTSEPIELPVNPPSEFSVDYQLVVIGSGTPNIIDRNLSAYETEVQEELNIEAYAIDNLLPTILDIGGNKDLLPPFGSSKEAALLNAVLPVLNANPQVLADIKSNDFKSASETLLPELFGDIRLSNELRTLLINVYNVLSDNGNLPNTFVQSNELTETGHDRFKKIMAAMYKNMDLKSKSSTDLLRTEARSVESWIVSSIDAEVVMVPKNIDLCLGEATEIRASLVTFFDPEVEEFEFHWKTSNKFSGRVQDINDDPSNFGASIITKSNVVSYISAALDSELGSGDNIETVTAIAYTKNKQTGELTEVGSDVMQVNNKKGCVSFYVPFTKYAPIDTVSESSLICGGEVEFRVSEQYFVATFKAVEGATGYKGMVKRSDGTFGNEFVLNSGSIREKPNGFLEYRLRVGSINILFTCNYEQAQAEQQERMELLDSVNHLGIEITPIF